MKPHFRLRLVKPRERPLGPLTRAEKLARARAFLQGTGEFSYLKRNIYLLDPGTPKPKWGVAGDPPKPLYKDGYRSLPNIIERMASGIRDLWSAK